MAQEAPKVAHGDLGRGLRLHLLRKLRGMKVEELAEKAEISTQMIWKYEREKADPTGDVLRRLAQALETSTDYLLLLSDSPQRVMPSKRSRQRNARQKPTSPRPIQRPLAAAVR